MSARIPSALQRFWLVMVAMTLASMVYTLAATFLFHATYPYGLPLFFADDRWFDFTIYHDRFQHFRQSSFWNSYEYPFTYPAPLAVLYGVLYKIPHVLRYYLVAYAGATITAALIFIRALRERGLGAVIAITFTATLVLFNYPLRTLFESANTEGVVAILAGCGVYSILRERCWLGATLLAIAGTMKIFPFILLALLLSKRRYREFAYSLVVAGVVTVTSLAIVGPTVAEAERHINAGIHYVKYTFIFATRPAAVTFNHSLFTLVKFSLIALDHRLYPIAELAQRSLHERALLDVIFNVYVTAAALFGLFAYIGFIRRLPLLNQVLALSACALLLPPLSADYTLLHLLLPFALLCLYAIECWRSNTHVRGLTTCMLCFAPVFSFQTYLTYHYRFACEFRTFGLIALLIVAMRFSFRWSWLDGSQDATTSSPLAS